MERHASLLDLSTAVGKRQFSDVLLPIVRRLSDSVEQDHYMARLAETLKVSRQALNTKMQAAKPEAKPVQKPVPTPAILDKIQVEYVKTQDHLMALLLLHPKIRPLATMLRLEMLVTGQARQLFEFLTANPMFSGDMEALPDGMSDKQVQSLKEYGNILVMQHETLYGDVEDLELDYEVTRLQARLIEQYIKTEKQKLTAQLQGAAANDEAATRQILTRVRELDTLRNQAQGGQRG